MSEEVIIFNTGPLRLKKYESDKYIELIKVYYPIYPYGNNVQSHIELDLENKRISHHTVRDSWNGTGRDDHGYVELSDEEAREIAELMRSVKTVEDFEKLVEKFYELKKKREEVAEKMFNEVVDAMLELIAEDERIRYLKMTKEELREKAEEFIEYLISDC